MTLTVRLDPDLNSKLRRRCTSEGKTKTKIVSEALERYLAEPRSSAYDLGHKLFGRYASRAGDVSRRRKSLYRDYVSEKRRGRR